MKYIYALIIVASPMWKDNNKNSIPYTEVNSIFKTYEECDYKISAIHDYYLAKDIRKKDSKRRKPKFIKGFNDEKILRYKYNNKNFFAICKNILE